MLSYMTEVATCMEDLLQGCLTQIKSRQKKLAYNPTLSCNKLVVEVVQARGLHAMDRGGTSDPFVVLSAGAQKANQKHTNVARKNLSPRWDEEFIFEDVDLRNEPLRVTVKDQDVLASDVMGSVEVDLSNLQEGQEVRGWYKLMKKASTRRPSSTRRLSFDGSKRGIPTNECAGEVELVLKLQQPLGAVEKKRVEEEMAKACDLAKSLAVLVLGPTIQSAAIERHWDRDYNGVLDVDEVILGLDALLDSIHELTLDYNNLINEGNLVVEIVREISTMVAGTVDSKGTLGMKQYMDRVNRGRVGTVAMAKRIKAFAALDLLEADGVFNSDGVVDEAEWASIYHVLPSIRTKYTSAEWKAKYVQMMTAEQHGGDGLLSRQEFNTVVKEEGLDILLPDKRAAINDQQAKTAEFALDGGRSGSGSESKSVGNVLSWDKVSEVMRLGSPPSEYSN
jgi:hypothetical protein